MCKIYSHSSSRRACPYAGAFEVASEAAFEEEA